jgi:hypothetical protein
MRGLFDDPRMTGRFFVNAPLSPRRVIHRLTSK